VAWRFVVPTSRDDRGDVLGALLALGYTSSEARRAVAALPQEPALSLEEQVREALRVLGGGG
jgi:Holliday junction resolvasome RuvABC DNA-binding subunit